MFKNYNWTLYGSVLSVNLISLISGIAYAWTSPILPKLRDETLEDNPFGHPITSFEESWLTSIVSIGASVGPFLGAALLDRIGRKKTLVWLSIPIIVPHLIFAFSNDMNLFYLGRFLIGLPCGCCYSIVPIFVGEMAEDKNRGALGSLLSMTYTVGTLVCFIIGPYVTIQVFCLLILIPSLLFLVLMLFFVPESPYYLLMSNREEEAKLALQKLRLHDVGQELEAMKDHVAKSSALTFNITSMLKSKAIMKGLVIGCGVALFQQLSGITVVIAYLQPIFNASGAMLPPEISAILVGSIRLGSNFITSPLVDKLGRKILLIISLLGAFISHALLGLYFYLQTNNYDEVVSYLTLLPVSSLILYMITFMVGLGPVTWVIIGEVFPTHLRSYASTLASFIALFAAFLLTFFFPNLTEMFGMASSFWLFAVASFIGVLFVWLVIPETKGKSLREVQVILEGGKL